jgi:hypothetical protein
MFKRNLSTTWIHQPLIGASLNIYEFGNLGDAGQEELISEAAEGDVTLQFCE